MLVILTRLNSCARATSFYRVVYIGVIEPRRFDSLRETLDLLGRSGQWHAAVGGSQFSLAVGWVLDSVGVWV